MYDVLMILAYFVALRECSVSSMDLITYSSYWVFSAQTKQWIRKILCIYEHEY